MARKLPQHAIYRFLDTDGDGTGTKNAIADYDATPDEFHFTPTADTELHRLVINITDTAGMAQSEYGNTGGALANGYEIKVMEGATEHLNLTDDVPVKTNADFGRYCYDVNELSWQSVPTNESVQVRWTFSRAGAPLYLPVGYRLSISFSDDMTGLIEHYFMVQGYEV